MSPWGWRTRAGVLLALVATGLATGCGAADERIDPADLELRDLLGVAPRVATGWDEAQRAAAREVLAAGLVERAPEPLAIERAARLDEAIVVGALADVDDRLLDRGRDALGLVEVDDPSAARAIDAPIAAGALLDGDAAPIATATALELDPAAWPCPREDTCDLGVLAALSADALPGAARVRVLPVVQLSTIAARLPAGADGVPTLLVNPVVTAVSEPVAGVAGAAGGGGARPALASVAAARVRTAPLVTSTWTYDPHVSDCATAVRSECTTCLGGGACPMVWTGVSGQDTCTMLEAQAGQNYDHLCINLALSLADIRACVADRAPGCAIDADALGDPAMLHNNSAFATTGACFDALAACLDQLYGSGGGDSCGACDGCSCTYCEENHCSGSNQGGGCNESGDNCEGGGCNDGGCNGGGCNDNSGGGCNNGGNQGSCSVARAPSRGAGAAAGLTWALLPVPAALLARRRARRRRR
jgi:hypothetical protein